jgi:hypothetical protein
MLKQPDGPVPYDISFLPVLSLRRNLEALARDFGFRIESGLDDLDEYKVVYLQLENGCKFLLMRYRGSPDDLLDIYIPAGRSDYRRCLGDILTELGAAKSEVIERQVEYERF